jgi:hypothetical protein
VITERAGGQWRYFGVFQHASRISYNDLESRNVTSDDGAGSDGCTVVNNDFGQDDRPGADAD